MVLHIVFLDDPEMDWFIPNALDGATIYITTKTYQSVVSLNKDRNGCVSYPPFIRFIRLDLDRTILQLDPYEEFDASDAYEGFETFAELAKNKLFVEKLNRVMEVTTQYNLPYIVLFIQRGNCKVSNLNRFADELLSLYRQLTTSI